MARKSITGLSERKGIWHIDKKINGERLYESTGTGDREEAERYLIYRLEQIRQQKVYGVKKVRIWREAATRFLLEFKDQPSIKLSAHHLSQLDPFIGDMPLTHIDDQALVPFIKDRLATKKLEGGKVKKGVSNRTVNISIERVVRVLSLCARKWRDDERRPWLDSVPMLTKLEEKKSSRKPYPMSWPEQSILLRVAGAPADDGAVQSEHRHAGAGGLQVALGLGDFGTGTRYQRLSDTCGLRRASRTVRSEKR